MDDNEIVNITEEQVCMITGESIENGQEIYVEVKLPPEIQLESFKIKGKVLSCRYMQDNGDDCYLLDLKIGVMPEEDEQILKAYVAFKKREDMLNDLNLDDKALQEAINEFGTNLKQLMGAIELLTGKNNGDITVH